MGITNKVLLAAGLAFGVNMAYRIVRINYLDYRLQQAEEKFQQDWDKSHGCPFDLIRDANTLERQLKYENEVQEKRILNPFYRLTAEN